ncbi:MULTISPECIES: hypothetical protein [unclassified Streptomyces]|uniref:Uncharacterized protein n=1 Tax=Streptomyces sp. NBC_00119 TaxID=2975659 RepID=A0AAU1UK41_9ACTN|nr:MULTISPECIES: hypothetical protein [unclassified Streptomyces]MCX4650078.1 hypothetical protein [Streptomyces sp. NBC_01446]MCX5320704.1 hypothetical protein [Streptomyces sp. NBC_00120]
MPEGHRLVGQCAAPRDASGRSRGLSVYALDDYSRTKRGMRNHAR